MVPVCALSLARGSAPLRRPRTATQGTRDCHEFTVTCAWMPRKNTRHVCSPHATARRAAAGVPGTGGPRSLSRAPPARSRGLRLRSPSCASRSAAPIVPDALRRRMAEPAAGGRDAVQLRQLARAQRGGAAGAAARRPVAQLEREYRTIIVSRTPGSRARAASAQTDAAAPAARARPRGRPSRARGARARRAGRGCRRRPRRRAAAPAAPATHPIACFEMLCFDRKIRGTGVLSKTRELG